MASFTTWLMGLPALPMCLVNGIEPLARVCSVKVTMSFQRIAASLVSKRYPLSSCKGRCNAWRVLRQSINKTDRMIDAASSSRSHRLSESIASTMLVQIESACSTKVSIQRHLSVGSAGGLSHRHASTENGWWLLST